MNDPSSSNPDLPDPFYSAAPADASGFLQLDPDQRWSRYDDMGVLTGPEPVPAWVITADGAVETELGTLKSGKEADVCLVERSFGDRVSVLAAKRYRTPEHRQFHRDSGYVEGRRTRNSRDTRAIAKRSRHGRAVEAGAWATTEFDTLCRFWSAGLPVPYPVQLDGTELLLEFITLADGTGAPRLAQTRPEPALLAAYWDQLRTAMITMAGMGLAHGDLSPYNLLAADERLVIIDLPQVIDVVANPAGTEFLARDCRNVARWFTARGLEVEADALLAELISFAW